MQFDRKIFFFTLHETVMLFKKFIVKENPGNSCRETYHISNFSKNSTSNNRSYSQVHTLGCAS